MLQFVFGRAGTGKTHYLRKLLVDMSGSENRRLMMIVPEQYSFETEKAIMQMAGPVRSNLIDVVSFTRLADMVFRQEGGLSSSRLSDGGRRILMDLAISACIDNLEVFESGAKDNKLTEIMLNAVNEMKMCGISSGLLEEISDSLPDRALSQKLSEISLIYGAYNALVENTYLDPRDELTMLYEVLETSDFFEGYTVAVDSFEGFTVQETGVLDRIMQKADNLIVSLCTDEADDNGTGIFSLVNRTEKRLKFAAKESGIKIMPPVRLYEPVRFKSEDLKVFERNLFSSGEIETAANNGDIKIYSAEDTYDEADFVAATIRNLVIDEGYKYSDFSIICRDTEKYCGCLGTALRKRDIPCFISRAEKVDAEPVMRFILSAFDTVLGYFNSDDIFEMLKTGISGFSSEAISELENYVFLWRISGTDWKKPFTKHPQGFGRELTEKDIELLEALNSMRERITKPLEKFSKAMEDESGTKISKAAYDLLCDFGIQGNLIAYCKKLESLGEDSLSQKQIRIWELLMEILNQMAQVLGDKYIGKKRYYKLLLEVIQGEDVSEIPQVLDEVLFGTPEQVRQASPKITFLIGVAQGELPLVPKANGVFSNSERKQLIEYDLPLSDSLEQKYIEERYLAYSAACTPSERLYISYPKNIDGEDAQPSELVDAVHRIFPNTVELNNLSDEYFANSDESAFSKMAAMYRQNTPRAEAYRRLFENLPEYKGKLEALDRATAKKAEEIADKSLAAEFFGNNPYLSASQIEVFHSCKFKYFCQYGLNAKERRAAQVDAMQYGTIMHYIFERVFSKNEINPYSAEISELRGFLDKILKEYAEKEMGGYETLPTQEKYRLGRMSQSAVILIKHICTELEQSEFEPEYYELRLGKDMPALKIIDNNGKEVTIGGVIDRVDLLEKNGKKFVRIVDYKTGRKEFKLIDVLYGLNMQMLVYLAALIEQDFIPAGILYHPAVSPSVSVSRNASEEEIEKETSKSLKMNGLILNNSEIVTAMEKNGKGVYIPASLLKDGNVKKTSSVLNLTDMQAVLDYSKRLIATMANELENGNVKADPTMVNSNSCRYCPYGAVCGKELDDSDVQSIKLKNEEIIEEIKKVSERGV